MKLLRQVWERRFAQYVAAYVAVAWGALQVVDQLVDRGVLGDLWYRLGLVVCLAGFLATMIISWYHGAKEDQRVVAREVWLLSLVGLLTLGAGGWVVRTYEPEDPASVARRLRAAALSGLAETEDPRRVAVLYFDPRSAGEEVPFLAAGLTESLIDELDAVDALHVVSRHGVAPYRGREVPPDSIGRALRVGTIVDGTVSAADDEIRINVEFLNANTGERFASTRVQGVRADFFKLQDDLIREVASYLRQRVGEELEVIARSAGTENVEAWQLLQRARAATDNAEDLWDAGDRETAWARLEAADSLLAEAEELAPEWVDPTVRRGWIAYWRSRWRGATEQTEAARWIRDGLEHARVALRMAPEDPEAHELRGTLRYWRYTLDLVPDPEERVRVLDEAEADLRRAVALDPNEAGAWATLVHLLYARGEVAQAKIASVKAYEADAYLRDMDVILWRLFLSSYDLGDAPEAAHWCDELGRRFPDDSRYAECRLWRMTMDGNEPDPDLAWRLADTLISLSPAPEEEADRRWSRMGVAAVLARAGLEDSARAVAARSGHTPSVDPTHDLTYTEAFVRTLVGDEDEAIDLLAEYLAATGAGPGDIDHWWFDGLREEPGYRELAGD